MTEAGTADAAQKHLTSHDIRVLLIDDQAMIGEAVRRMLEGEDGIEFHFCQDPAQAMKTALDVDPTVILQDLVMPEIDGLTLVKYFRANTRTKDAPLIVLSTKEDPAVKAEAFALGANDYLVKLPDRIELIARIRYHSTGYINLIQRNEALRHLQNELDEAAEYVKKLMPAPLVDGPIRTDWRFISSTSLGGDSLGYHWLSDDAFAFYVLDVTGHGVGSALLSVSVQNVIRSQSLPGTDFGQPDQVLCGLNEAFPMEEHNGNMFSLWYGVYYPADRLLAYSSGGHPPALVLSGPPQDPRLEQLRTKGMMVGGLEGFPFQQQTARVPEGARMYVYSDGAYEIRMTDGRMWPFEGFTDFMRQPPPPGESIIDRLHAHVRAISGEETLEDDFSMLELVFD
jgi:sigma-B regulation protein RsbU (phosphoserine phosphatase)